MRGPSEPNPRSSGRKRKLPLGIQTFRKIREGGYYYVDKTGFVRQLLEDDGTHFFLSRPRRFGKSLLLDTIQELFEGNAALFRGLAAEGHQKLTAGHPVVRLDFSGGDFTRPEHLHRNAMAQLEVLAEEGGVAVRGETAPIRFSSLIRALRRKTGKRVVALVDEYDKPILDALEDPELARANRNFLRGLYGVIKFCEGDIELTLLTGVSKFSKVSLFSGLNNLLDITLDPKYSAICGYTEADLDAVFSAELPGLDRETIRDWYNGYNWLGAENVYNPYDLLLLFRHRAFGHHWFETGTPRFLIERVFRLGLHFPRLAGLRASSDLLSAFDVDEMEPEALLFQAGYLTIKGVEETDDPAEPPRYRLGYPNREVRRGLAGRLLRVAVPRDSHDLVEGARLRRLLAAGDFARVEELFRSFFDSIPYEWYSNNDIARYEGYYASVFYGYLEGSGLTATVEDSSNRGRLDLAVRARGRICLFEFKVVEEGATGAALSQLKTKRYAERYRRFGEPIHLVGVEFSRATRNVVAFDTEHL